MRIRPLLLSILLAAAVPAFAAEPTPAPERADEAREAAAATAEPAQADRSERHCLRSTGSRIRAREGDRPCLGVAGRVWTREDIERTGRTDVADALRTLDVSIR